MRFKGELLKKLRKESGYTQEKLSDITKIPRSTINNYVFDIYIEDFVEFEEEELPDIWSE